MVPITVAVEKKVAESLWNYVRSWFHSKRDLQNENEILRAQLAEERSGKLAFQRMVSELECRPEDDHMYWKKDGSGGPYCPICLDAGEKRIPLIHGNREGSFLCNIHQQFFETDELRRRERQAIQNRAQAGRRSSEFGPHSWMR